MKLVRTLFSVLLSLVGVVSMGQGAPKVQLTGRLLNREIQVGQQTQILIEADVAEGWHMFGNATKGDWVNISAALPPDSPFALSAPLVEPKADIRNVPGFDKPGAFFEGKVTFALPVSLQQKGDGHGLAKFKFQACDASSCLPPKEVDIAFDYVVKDGVAPPARPVLTVPPQAAAQGGAAKEVAAPVDETTANIQKAQSGGLLTFFLLALGAGFLALLTPCVWPMIPVTVSFFSKTAAVNGKPDLRGALAYCFGIIGTFVGLGLLVTALFGASGIQRLAAHPLVNAALGILFVYLALNLFGVVELSLPSGLLNRAQAGSRKGGLIGPVLMGLTFSLTSFTCTVPFVGTLLASSAHGSILFPIVGMFGFSLAFALPFFGLALFPGYLAKMPKSGGWLVTVKAYMGFLELAAALKFFSNFDVTVNPARPLGLLPQEVFLAIWFSLFTFAGMYLLGWIKFPMDAATKIGLPRRLFGVANIGIAIYLLGALSGTASLGSLTAFLPAYSVGKNSQGASIAWSDNVTTSASKARTEGKLVFINFTGQTCSNCRVMEKNVFPKSDIAALINQMVPVELYTDRDSDSDRKNAALREQLTNTSTNPVYVIMTPDMKVLSVYQGGTSAEQFKKFLEEGLAKKG